MNTIRDILDKMIWDIALDDGVGDGEKQINQALKEISELLLECSDVESISKSETFLEGYATAKDEIKANLLEALQ